MSGYWMQTYTGLKLNYLEPKLEQIDILDIATHLSREGRFANATKFHYTVGYNAILMCEIAPEGLELEFLLDDAEEAYTRDIPKPFKEAMIALYGGRSPFDIIAKRIKSVIVKKFKLDNCLTVQGIVKEFDNRLALTEDNQLTAFHLMKEQNPSLRIYETFDIEIKPRTEDEIRDKFLELYNKYRRDK